MAPAPAAAATAAAAEEEQRPRPTSDADAPNADADAATLPVIDLASYNDDDDEAQSQLARDLRHACETVGFFFLENHGVSQELIDRTFAAARAFFALPAAKKQHTRASAATKNRGWTPPEAETLDPAHQKTRGDLKEGFYVGREIDKGNRMAALPLHGPNVWPRDDSCPGFREACEAYHSALTALAKRLLPAVAEAAGAPCRQSFVDAVFGEHGSGGGGGDDEAAAASVPYSSGPMAFLRLLSYLPEASEAEAGVLGCGAHSDWGMLTFLMTDGSPGLQVLRRRKGGGEGDEGDAATNSPSCSASSYWQDVPPRPGAFVVNVGDMLERWTGGRLRSTVHRVVVPRDEAEAGRRRQSLAFFLDPSFSALIAPADNGGDGVDGKYAPVRAGEYLLQRYRETHAGFEAGEGGGGA